MMSAIYEENKDEDGFLYMSYSGENTFGVYWNATMAHLCVRAMQKKKKLKNLDYL
jgi:hypothetical protein